MNRRERRPVRTAVVVLVCAAGAALLGSGCGSSSSSSTTAASSGNAGSSSSSGSKSPIVIGIANNLSGPAAAFDVPVDNGVKLAVADINAQGGIAGHPVKIVEADQASSISRGPAAVTRVIGDGAKVVIPACDYDLGGGGSRAAGAKGIVTVSCGGDPLYGKQGTGPLHFSVEPSTNSEAAAMAALGRQHGWKNAYLLTDTSIGYSKSLCSYFGDSWKKMGGTVTGQQTFVNSDPSIASQVSAIRAAQSSADVLVLCSYPPGHAAALRQLRAGGVTLPILGGLGDDGRIAAGAVPKLSDYYYVAFGSIRGGDPNPFMTTLGQKYAKRFGSLNGVEDYAPIMGYAIAQTIAKGIAANGGSTDGASLAKAIEKFTDQDVTTEHITYTGQCHTPVKASLVVLRAQAGKISVAGPVATQDVAAAPC